MALAAGLALGCGGTVDEGDRAVSDSGGSDASSDTNRDETIVDARSDSPVAADAPREVEVDAGPPQYTSNGLFAGGDHTCFIDQVRDLACFGANRHGELGEPPSGPILRATRIAGARALIGLALGNDHVCAILPGKTVRCWGKNDHGQLGDGTTTERWAPTDVPGLSDVDAIAVGLAHTCAATHGEIWCWGLNDDGQLGDGTTLERLRPTKVLGSAPSAESPLLFLGARHGCAMIAVDGARGLRCWGRNVEGQLGDGTTTTRVVPVEVLVPLAFRGAASESTTCVEDGAHGVRCAGTDPVNHWSSTWTPVVDAYAESMSGGARHYCGKALMGMRCWGDDSLSQLGGPPLMGGTQWSEIAVGGNHGCAAFLSTLWCWGKNDQGQTGKGSTSAFEHTAVRVTF